MTWYERQSSSTPRPVTFAEKAPARAGLPAWMVRRGAGAVIQSAAVFQRRGPGFAQPQDTDREQAIEPGPSGGRVSVRPADLHVIPIARPPTLPPAAPSAIPIPAATAAPPSLVDPRLNEALEHAISEVAELRRKVMKGTEHQLVALAARIARKVIGREVSEDPRILLALATEGIESLVSRDQVTIRIGAWMSDDAFDSFRARLQAQYPGCRVVQDPDLGLGGCVVETDMGKVDESLETRLSNVISALLPEREEGTW